MANVLLTAEEIAQWRIEQASLEEEIRLRQERLVGIKRRLDAAEVFLNDKTFAVENLEPPPSAISAANGRDDDDDGGPSVANSLLANMVETGASLKVGQIRQRLVDIGFGERVKSNPTYVYGLVYRLAKRGRLVKRGSKYRAVVRISPEGETGASSAPAH
jgi:hypothetical protein